MAAALTEEEYEAHLRDLAERIRAHLERGEGDRDRLLNDCEKVLELADDYPAAVQRHPEIEGLVGELLAKRQQDKFMRGVGGQQQHAGILSWFSRILGRGR